MNKRFLAMLLAVVMVMSMIPATVFAAEEAPALPTATVTPIFNGNLTFALNFLADNATEEQIAYYGDWYADYVLTVNKDITFNKSGGDGYLAGQYDAWSSSWVYVPDGTDVAVKANEPVRVMETALKLLGYTTRLTYAAVYEEVKDFDCGVYFTPEFLEANPDLEVTLELRVYNPENDAENYAIGNVHKFTAAEGGLQLPTATVSDLGKNIVVEAMDAFGDQQNYATPVTFAMNFKLDDPTEDQMKVFGKWYADFELKVNADVSGADAYLVGNYGDFGWIKLAFPEDMVLPADEVLKVMGMSGKNISFEEIKDSVKSFDCGVGFTPEFLAAHPDLEVSLELKMYNLHNLEENYVIGKTYTFTADDAKVNVGDNSYITVEEAVENAKDADVIELPVVENTKAQVPSNVLDAVANVATDVSVAIPTKEATVTLDKEAITAIAGNEAEGEVVLKVEDVTSEEEEGTAKVYEITLTKGEEKISDLVGYADVTVAYNGKDPVVYYVDGENKTEMEIVSFADGFVTFRTPHFSTFMVTENEVPALPEAIASETDRDIVVDAVLFGDREGVNKFEAPVTFTMNFKAVEPTAAQLDYYKKWYVDYELTVNTDVRGVDGYLIGQYDEYSPYWVKMGDETNTNVVIPANQPIRVMKTLFLGTKSEHMSYNDIVTFVKDFDCGIYFTDEFLAAHPDLEVTLELKMWNLHDESEIYTIGEPYTFVPTAYVAQIGDTMYHDLQDAFNAGGEVKLLVDMELTDASFKIAKGVTVDFDLNGHSIHATENSTAFYGLIVNSGNLTVKDSVGNGKLSVTATQNRGWASRSVVLSNECATMTVENGLIVHNGGTDMAFAIDNLTNGTIGDAVLTVNGGTVQSTYRAIRQFANSASDVNAVTINGGTFLGAENNHALWIQSPNAKNNYATLDINGGTVRSIYVYQVQAENIAVTFDGGEISALKLYTTVATNITKAEEVALTAPEGYCWHENALVDHHTWGDPVRTEATTTANAFNTFTCVDCGATKVEEIPGTQIGVEVPEVGTLVEGQTVTLSVTVTEATPTSYLWQKLSGSTWYRASVYENYTTAVATYKDAKPTTSGKYRCRMVINGQVVYSDIIEVKVEAAPVKITIQPSNKEVVYGNRFELATAAQGTGTLSYQWQYWNVAEENWKNLYPNQRLTLTADENAAPKYRCRVTNVDTGHYVYTDEITLTILEPQFSISKQPADVNQFREHRVIFSIDIEREENDSGLMRVKFQHYNEKTGKWETAQGFKYNATTYGVKVIESRLGKYRFEVSVGGRVQHSNVVELTMAADPVRFVNVPAEVTGKLNETVNLSVGVEVNEDVIPSSYQWQLMGSDGKWYSASEATDEYADLAVELTSKNVGKKYRCLARVQHSEGVIIMYSDIITLASEE